MLRFIDTWYIHNRTNLYLLDATEEACLGNVSASKGRTTGEQFAHVHNVRLMWFKVAAPELPEKVGKIEKEAITKKLLMDELTKSGDAMAGLLQRGLETGKIKGFKPHAAAFLGYFISHESHHRGQVMLTLKQFAQT